MVAVDSAQGVLVILSSFVLIWDKIEEMTAVIPLNAAFFRHLMRAQHLFTYCTDRFHRALDSGDPENALSS